MPLTFNHCLDRLPASALIPGGRLVAEFSGRGNNRAILDALFAARTAAGLSSGTELSPWYYPSIAAHTGLLEAHGLEVTLAQLFYRPTPLDGGDDGLRNWLHMFAGAFVSDLAPEVGEMIFHEVEERLRREWYRDNRWVADYRRLRVVAVREP